MSGDENTALLVAVQAKKPLWEDARLYVRWPANLCRLTWLVVATSHANVLLIFVPLGTIAGVRSWDPMAVFVLNFLAIIPLAALLTFATEGLSAKLGQTWKGLINAMFTNAVKLIVSKGGSGVTE
jgi:Ca2+:H+ antiporter